MNCQWFMILILSIIQINNFPHNPGRNLSALRFIIFYAMMIRLLTFMKEQFVVTHRYTILQVQKLDRSLIDKYLSMLGFLRIEERANFCFFCGHKILTEGVFVTQVFSNAGISFNLFYTN
jgi:hypothetical protein